MVDKKLGQPAGGGDGPGTLALNERDPRDPRESDSRMGRPDRDAPHEDEQARAEREFTDADWRKARESTDPERRRKIRETYSQSLLPDLPKKNGFRRCWVSTTHSIDTPSRRLALGYTFVRPEDVAAAHFSPEDQTAKDGAFKGCVMWREMVAMELPMDFWTDLMREFHHDAPREMAMGVYENLQELQDRAASSGSKIDLEEGFREAQRFVRPPSQFQS